MFVVYCRVWFETTPYNVSPQKYTTIKDGQHRPFSFFETYKNKHPTSYPILVYIDWQILLLCVFIE
jgi:hypothetical protein